MKMPAGQLSLSYAIDLPGVPALNRALPSIRSLLLTLALACVAPVALLSLGLITYHYQRERTQVEAGTVATARALMANVDERLHGVQLALTGLSKSPLLAAGD